MCFPIRWEIHCGKTDYTNIILNQLTKSVYKRSPLFI